MNKDLKNKVFVVTGGAEGIGFAIADKFLEKGAKFAIILDINEDLGTEAVNTLTSRYGENKAVFIKCDVTTDLDEVSKKIFDMYKTVDILVNNAGVMIGFKPRDAVGNKKCIDINVTATILWSMKFWQHMRKDKGGNGGTILNLASIISYRIHPLVPVYQASKFAIRGFTQSIGHKYNYDRSSVRAIAVCPGFTNTSLAHGPKADHYYDDDVLQGCEEYFQGVWQDASDVGKGAVDAFEIAESGTVWEVEGASSIKQIL